MFAFEFVDLFTKINTFQGDIEEGTSDKLIRAAEAKTAQAAAVTLQQKTGLLTRTGPMQRSGVMVDNKVNGSFKFM